MTFKNNTQRNKLIAMIVLIALAITLFCFSIIKLPMFLLIMVICLYLFFNALYYFLKTGLRVGMESMTLCYNRSSSTIFFPRLIYVVLEKKDVISVSRQVDKTKAMLCVVIEETNGKHLIQNMLTETQINDFITSCEESGYTIVK